jgi:HTH-type transcriptional regulator, competence development regulator
MRAAGAVQARCDDGPVPRAAEPGSLGAVLREARRGHGLSLREVERRTGIHNAHLSQLETGGIARPEMALLWDLAALYELDFSRLLQLAGHRGGPETAGERRQRMTVALRALGELDPEDQAAALDYIAELKRRRTTGG